MAFKLNSLFNQNNYLKEQLDGLKSLTKEDLWILDHRDRVLYSEPKEAYINEIKLEVGGKLVGIIRGGEVVTKAVNQAMNSLLKQQSDLKKVGSEVLSLYREINLIYNFSEKLAEIIDPAGVAELALSEASKIIPSECGQVILWEDKEVPIKELARFGDEIKIENELEIPDSKLHEIYKNGLSEILPGEKIKKALREGFNTGSVLFSTLKIKSNVFGAIVLYNHNREYTAGDLKFLTTIGLQSASAIDNALLYEKRINEAHEREEMIRKVNEATSRFVPMEFIESIGRKSLLDVRLGDHTEKTVTVVFVDIRSYTTLSEQMDPEENFMFVNAFNARLGPIIKKYNGFINQYLGDGLMAIFPDSPSDALRGAVEIQLEIIRYNVYRAERGRKKIKIGVGLHTGSLIMGITGDTNRLEAATISDTVNTASRIENLTKYYKSDIIFSKQTLDLLEDQNEFLIRHLGKVQVKGRNTALDIYECFDGNEEEFIKLKLDTLDYFTTGIKSYLSRSFRDSTKAFSQVLVQNPDDETAQWFLAKISTLLQSQLNDNWTGVEKMMTK